eukprot:SAG22_NODE_5954_length_926_cov_0.859734_1_plen_83_part_00
MSKVAVCLSQAGQPAARQPGSQAARQPGSQAARQPGRQPGRRTDGEGVEGVGEPEQPLVPDAAVGRDHAGEVEPAEEEAEDD